MTRLLNLTKSLKSDRRGVTALEYGLMACIMAVLIVGAVGTFGHNLYTAFSDAGTALTTQGSTASGLTAVTGGAG